MFGKYWIVFGWNGVTETLIPDFMLILVEMGTQSSDILKPPGLWLESKVSIILDKISNCRFGAKHGELPFLRWSEMWWAAGFVNSFKNRDQDLFTFHIHPQANAHLVLPAVMTGRGGSFFSISFKICLHLSGFLIHPSFPFLFFSLTHQRCEDDNMFHIKLISPQWNVTPNNIIGMKLNSVSSCPGKYWLLVSENIATRQKAILKYGIYWWNQQDKIRRK